MAAALVLLVSAAVSCVPGSPPAPGVTSPAPTRAGALTVTASGPVTAAIASTLAPANSPSPAATGAGPAATGPVAAGVTAAAPPSPSPRPAATNARPATSTRPPATTGPSATPEPPDPVTPRPPGAPVTLREAQVTLSTYPFARFLRIEQDPVTGQPAQVLDWAAYEASSPRPAPVAYQAVILENAFLRLTLLPDLGGRIYECVFKPTGNNELYGNPVVKPTHWGPPHPPYPAGSNWWPAAGGIEWGFPVEEHGFVFGTKWAYDHTEGEDGSITVGLFSSAATRPYVTIDVTLAPNSASFLVEPSITNPGDEPFRFKFWANAMLAPGKANAPGPDLRLLFPGREVLVHSSGDPALPAPGQRMSWPLYGGRDMSRLGTWSSYLGFFAPAPVAWSGVYDTAADEGMLRVSGSGPARGAKAFAAGWSNPPPSTEWTDDRSGYVELHSGLMPDFEQWYELPPGERVTWGETWYPAARVGGVVAASEHGALNLRSTPAGMRFDFMPVRPGTYRIELSAAPGDPNQSAAEGQAAPGQPFTGTLPAPAGANPTARILDATGRELLTYRP